MALIDIKLTIAYTGAIAFFILVLTDLSGGSSPSIFKAILGTSFLLWLGLTVAQKSLVGFFLKKSLLSISTLVIVASVTFLFLKLLPGGPFDEDIRLPPQVKANIEAYYGLDKPILSQYLDYMQALLRGDLGESFSYQGYSVSEIIGETFPVSVQLGGYALILAFLIGVPMGLLVAVRPKTFIDSATSVLASGGVALPSFFLAPILIGLFSFGWPFQSLAPDLYHWLLRHQVFLPVALWNTPAHYVLPVLTLSVRPMAIIVRLTKNSAAEVLQSDFIRTARAKGLSETHVLVHHVLQSCITPVVTYSGPLVAGVLSGSFVVEVIFAVPGVAKYFLYSISNRDYPLAMGLTLLYCVVLIGCNFLVDVFYRLLDPRVKL